MATSLSRFLTAPTPLSLSDSDLNELLEPLKSNSNTNTNTTDSALANAILSRKLDSETSSKLLSTITTKLQSDTRHALAILAAILKVAPHTAIAFLNDNNLKSQFNNTLHTITNNTSTAPNPSLVSSLTQLLAEAAAVASLRPTLREQAAPWLNSQLTQKFTPVGKELNDDTKVLAALALIKLALGREDGAPPPKPKQGELGLQELGTLLQDIFIRDVKKAKTNSPGEKVQEEGPFSPTALSALEGLSYLTLPTTPHSPKLKSSLITPTSPFLVSLLPLKSPPKKPEQQPPPLPPHVAYTLATLLHHLTQYPSLTPPQTLPKALSDSPAPEERTSVSSRNTTLVNSHGTVLDSLHSLLTSRAAVSTQTRTLAVLATHSLVESPSLRPSVVQAGLVRDLRNIVLLSPPSSSSSSSLNDGGRDDGDNYKGFGDDSTGRKNAVQAIAKCLITARPDLVFDKKGGALLDVAFVLVVEVARGLGLGDEEGKGKDTAKGLFGSLGKGRQGEEGEPERLLRTFECLMALTNIVSLGGEIAEKIAAVVVGKQGDRPSGGGAKEGGGERKPMMKIVEDAMLSSNPMIQRAATELACNLVSTEAGVAYYDIPCSDTTSSSSMASEIPPSLNLLLALCSSEDLPTQLAASGALATLFSYSPFVTFRTFSHYPEKGWDTFFQLVLPQDGDDMTDDDEGLRVRAWDWMDSLARWVSEDGLRDERGREKVVVTLSGEGRDRLRERLEKAKEARRGPTGAKGEVEEVLVRLMEGVKV
ncbi:hypothetical protein T439DRAFT_362717 [Meredithblackwellia eburnea MCA 4105]